MSFEEYASFTKGDVLDVPGIGEVVLNESPKDGSAPGFSFPYDGPETDLHLELTRNAVKHPGVVKSGRRAITQVAETLYSEYSTLLDDVSLNLKTGTIAVYDKNIKFLSFVTKDNVKGIIDGLVQLHVHERYDILNVNKVPLPVMDTSPKLVNGSFVLFGTFKEEAHVNGEYVEFDKDKDYLVYAGSNDICMSKHSYASYSDILIAPSFDYVIGNTDLNI